LNLSCRASYLRWHRGRVRRVGGEILCFLDNTNEALAGILRTGRAGSNTAADHIAVLDQALGQLPEAARSGRILVRTDGAGFSHAFVDHLLGLGLQYSVGYAVTEDVRDGIAL